MAYTTRVLTIAGSDSGAGAGIQADLKTVTACGCYATTAITAITAQNTLGVIAIEPLSLGIVERQITAVLDDIGADAVKIGMLPNGETAELVAHILKSYGVRNIVLDPVLVATSGDSLAGESTVSAILKYLLPIATVITPNIPETEVVTGVSIVSASDFESAWDKLRSMGSRAALIKGGHLEGDELIDMLFTSDQAYSYTSQRLYTKNTHGTGCTLSSAVASFLANGLLLPDAVRLAVEYTHMAIEHADQQHVGGGHGPVNHFYEWLK